MCCAWPGFAEVESAQARTLLFTGYVHVRLRRLRVVAKVGLAEAGRLARVVRRRWISLGQTGHLRGPRWGLT
jgi:hypothetical protein